MRAIGVHTFAGGICMGVRQHFDIVKCYEPLNFGVQTLRERLGLVVSTANPNSWLPSKVDFVFGNPRCGGFSNLGSNSAVPGKTIGMGCQQSVDALQLCEYAAKNAVPVACFESVQSIMHEKNRGFVDGLMHNVFGTKKYRFAHVFVDTAMLESCQYRRRYFFVAYRRGLQFNVSVPSPISKMKTIRDTIGMLQFGALKRNEANVLRKNSLYDELTHSAIDEDVKPIVPWMEQGDSLNHLHHRYGPSIFKALDSPRHEQRSKKAKSNIPFGVAGNTWMRLKWDASCPTIVGNSGSRFIHPHYDRVITIKELCLLMGWPTNVIPAGPYPTLQVAKSYRPQVNGSLTVL